MKHMNNIIALLLFVSFGGACAEAAPKKMKQYDTQVFTEWSTKAFGITVRKNAEGVISAMPMDDLTQQAASWYRCNAKGGMVPTEVPVYTQQEGDFFFVELDFSDAWPEATYAKRHLVYYLGDENPYIIVRDEIKSKKPQFWTMQLEVPTETLPVNWAIDLRDAGRKADLMAGLEGQFEPGIKLNRPVSGYAKAKTGAQMLLARLLKLNNEAEKYADKMPPMSIRQQDGVKWLTNEVRSSNPSMIFALVPYTQNKSELPTTLLSETSVRMEWYKKSHQYMFEGSEAPGSLALMLKTKSRADIQRFGFRTEYQEIERPSGELIAEYTFNNLKNGKAVDGVGGFDAEVERGKLVDGLEGKSIYLGYPDRPKRNSVKSGVHIPEAIRQKLTAGHMTLSYWYKSPMGQARQNSKNWMWPIGEIMRSRGFLNTGFFGVGHTHYNIEPAAKGFNAAWQIRANSGALTPGKWNHLVFTMQELNPAKFLYRYEVYVNGVIRTSAELGPMKDKRHCKLWKDTKGPITIGNTWSTMDNLRVYNYPLGEDEVVALYEKQLEKKVSYYSCDSLGSQGEVISVPQGNYPEDSIVNNQWVKERTFAGIAKNAKLVPSVKGKALAVKKGITIPEKALWDLAQGAFTFSFYFKYSGKGCGILNTKGIRLSINWNTLHGAVGNQWEDKYLGYKEKKVDPDVWHHIVLTYDKRSMKCYLDGGLLYDRFMASSVGINFHSPITLGSNCDIDEINIYNYAIDDAEVKKLGEHLVAKKVLK